MPNVVEPKITMRGPDGGGELPEGIALQLYADETLIYEIDKDGEVRVGGGGGVPDPLHLDEYLSIGAAYPGGRLGIRGYTDDTEDLVNIQHGAGTAYRTIDGGTNAVLLATAVAPGAAGNDITVLFTTIFNGALAVDVVGTTITVTVATENGFDTTSTANEIIAAVVASAAASALITMTNAPGSDGTGIPSSSGSGVLGHGRDIGDAFVLAADSSLTLSTLVIEPLPSALYGLHLMLDSEFDNVASGRFTITVDGQDQVVFDSGGLDLTTGAGLGQVVIRLFETDTGAHTDIGSREWLLRAQDGTTELAKISELVGVLIGKTTVPADSDISNSQLALWFDHSDGAAKLMLKGKSSDGTVVTGNVALI